MFFGGHGDNFMQREDKTFKLYDTLGVNKKADNSEIKKSYRKLAMKHHPDRGGDEAKFKEINQAYEILSNSDKRESYDQIGDAYLEQGGDVSMGGNPFDIFNMFTGHSREHTEKNVTQPIIKEFNVELVDLYKGKECSIKIERENYKIKNGKDISDCFKKCSECKGKGVCVQVRQIGPMIQQMQTTCNKCKGKGKSYNNNIKMYMEEKQVSFSIEKGMKNKDNIILYQESHRKPGYISGDIVIILKQKSNPIFHREGNNLKMLMSIKLVEALCGFQKIITSLDNRKLLVQSSSVIKEDTLMYIPNEGMPNKNNPQDKGNLIVSFNIEYPKQLTREQKKILMENFYLPEFIKNNGNYEFVKLKKYNKEENIGDNSDENSDDDISEKPVECIQQ